MSSPPSPSPSIGHAMNTATRPLHTTLNRAITSLLPLSLPPHTTSPLLYAHGMHSILPIYTAFESTFTHLLTSPPPTLSPRTRHLLQTLHIPALSRTARLRSDLSLLLPPPLPLPNYDHQPEAHHGAKLAAFTAHITAAITARPHLLIAYTWNLYMALFSGGRYLRSQLRSSGLFGDVNINMDKGLSFWAFDGTEDGEDLKRDFKARVMRLEAQLTHEERVEIVSEGVEIMRGLVEVVGELEREIPLRTGGLLAPELRGGAAASKADEDDEDVGGFGSLQGSVRSVVASLSRSVVEGLGWRHGNTVAAATANALA